MADIQSQILEARKAGYDDAAIAAHLSDMPEYGSKMKTALDAGYKPAEILSHLTVVPKSLVDQIPGMPPVTAPAPSPSLYQRVLGAAEVVPGLIGGAVSSVAAPVAGLVSSLTSGKFGTPEGAAAGERTVKRTQEMLGYRPVTQPGAENIQAVGEAMAPLVGVPVPTMNALARTSGAPLRLATNALRAGTIDPLAAAAQARQGRITAGKVAQSYQNAPQIEAAQIAVDRGFALNPSVSNPNAKTKFVSAVAGKEGDVKLAENNVEQAGKVVRDDLGLKPTAKLDLENINKALDEQSKPYDVVRDVYVNNIPTNAQVTLDNARVSVRPHNVKSAQEVNSLIDRTIEDLFSGEHSGNTIINDIRALRKDALDVYKAKDKGLAVPDPEKIAVADAKMAIADAYEQVLESNVKNPNDVSAMRAARVRMAQTYDHLRALDFATGKIDPQAYAKMFNERQGKMTGVGADIGRVAANYPAVMSLTEPQSFSVPRIVRGGLGATIGGALGSLGGPLGIPTGIALGVGTGAVAGSRMAKRIATPAFQAKNAVPPDYRGPVSNAPAAVPPTTMPVPYTSEGGVLRPSEYPNWVPGRQNVEPDIRVQPPQGPAQITNQSAMDVVAQQRQQQYARESAAATAADELQARQEAFYSTPAGRGLQLERDPVTGRERKVSTGRGTQYELVGGKLRPVSQGMVGATPDTILSAAYPLNSAVAKITSGRNFALSAEEKVAWDKTRVDIAEVAPGFNKLSDKAVLGKMQDRAWVEDAIQKARDKAAAFDEIANRAKSAQEIRDAVANRDRMLGLAESMDEGLRAGRPVAKTSQGPKTRAAIRNKLIPEDANINSLRP